MSISKTSQTKIFPKVDHITLTVKDFAKSKSFYKELFVDFFGGETALDELDVFGVRFGKGFMFGITPENPEFTNSKFNRYQVGLHHICFGA